LTLIYRKSNSIFALDIGNHVWIGEQSWIDNLGLVSIADNVCISQGALLLTGNHDYKKQSFDLRVGEIHLQQGCWIGARATVPGVTVHEGAVLAVASIATHDLDAGWMYQGNPAVKVRIRK